MTVALEALGNYVFLHERSCFGVLTRFQRLGSIFVRRSFSCARSFVGDAAGVVQVHQVPGHQFKDPNKLIQPFTTHPNRICGARLHRFI